MNYSTYPTPHSISGFKDGDLDIVLQEDVRTSQACETRTDNTNVWSSPLWENSAEHLRLRRCT
jgi:hypothetical protein